MTKRAHLLTAAVIALACLVLLFDYFYLIKNSAPFSWDEAHHSLSSLAIARSWVSGDPGAFWRDTNAQIYWPFLHSWVSAPFLLLGGYDYSSPRLASAFFGACSIILVYLLGRRIFNPSVGAGAALLLALSPIYHTLSSTVMAENLGLFLILVLILLFFRIWETGKKRLALAAGALIAVLYLTKYVYGAFFGTALVGFLASLLILRDEDFDRKRAFRTLPWVIAGFLLVWGTWMIVPPNEPKLRMFFFRIGDTGGWNPFDYSRSDNHLFFVRALYYAYGFSIATYLLYIGGLIFGLLRVREAKTRFLLFVVLANFIPMSMIVNSQERFAYLGFAPLLLLAAAGAQWCWIRLSKNLRWAAAIFLVFPAMGDLHKLPALYRQTANAILSVNLHRQELRFDYSTLFGLTEVPRFFRYPKKYFNPSAATAMNQDTREVIAYVKSVTDPRYPLCVPAWLGTLSPHLWQWEYFLAGRPVVTAYQPGAVYFLLLEVAQDSPYNRLGNLHLIDGLRRWKGFLQKAQSSGLMDNFSTREFPEIGLTVKIFIRIAPLDHSEWKNPDLKF